MSTVSYRDLTGSGAENYQRDFVPAIATPVSAGLMRAAALRPGERVLDVACGTGAVTRLAAAAVGGSGSVVGIDLTPDMIEVAKATPAPPTPPSPPIEWHVGDAASLPFPDASFDVVLCQMGLMFMDDRAAACREMRRVLVPGGRVAVNTPGSIQPVFAHMEQAIVEHISPDLGGFVRAVFSMDDPQALSALLRDAGLAEVEVSVSDATFLLPSPAEFLWQYINLTPMAPLVAEAPEASKAAMERQVVERLQPYVVDGGTHFEQPMVIATGRS